MVEFFNFELFHSQFIGNLLGSIAKILKGFKLVSNLN